MWCNFYSMMQYTKSANLIGHSRCLLWWQLDGLSVTRSSCAKGVACKTILYMCWPLPQRPKWDIQRRECICYALETHLINWVSNSSTLYIWVIPQYLNFPNIFTIIQLENSCDVLAYWLKSWTDQKITLVVMYALASAFGTLAIGSKNPLISCFWSCLVN